MDHLDNLGDWDLSGCAVAKCLILFAADCVEAGIWFSQDKSVNYGPSCKVTVCWVAATSGLALLPKLKQLSRLILMMVSPMLGLVDAPMGTKTPGLGECLDDDLYQEFA